MDLKEGFACTVLALLSGLLTLLVIGQSSEARRSWPDSTSGIHVFNDQLAPNLSDAQQRFAAQNYAGTQKLFRRDATAIRRYNSNFMVLHYRLGHGLGYRYISGDCTPSGDFLGIVAGNRWQREWPRRGLPSGWFVTSSSRRVLNCDWGWYLMDISKSGYRRWWHREVLRQMRANDNDGIFMDSLSVPNYLGPRSYRPALPDVDEGYERRWSRRIDGWLKWLQKHKLGRSYQIVPNVGSWITSRDATTYKAADGFMVEGFALEADASPYNLEDWQLQMGRIIGLVSQGKALIAQNYVSGERERMFTVGSYLLVKGSRSYVNIDSGYDPEWWPEYDIPIGTPSESAGGNLDRLRQRTGLYSRRFSNGVVYVNATSPWDGSATTHTVQLGQTYYLAQTSGGGTVDESGRKPGEVSYRQVEEIELAPYSAAVLLTNVNGAT